MLIVIDNVFSLEKVNDYRERLLSIPWQDGRKTAGIGSGAVKKNLQLDANDVRVQQISQDITKDLLENPLFVSATLPHKILPPLFNCYEQEDYFGVHVDNAIRGMPNGDRMRTDISCTLFLSDNYEGGVLTIETLYGAQQVKLPAGSLVLYPSTSLHHVTPIESGQRLCAFFWIQSIIQETELRTMLFDMDQSLQSLGKIHDLNHPDILRLSGIYHNLVRKYAAV